MFVCSWLIFFNIYQPTVLIAVMEKHVSHVLQDLLQIRSYVYAEEPNIDIHNFIGTFTRVSVSHFHSPDPVGGPERLCRSAAFIEGRCSSLTHPDHLPVPAHLCASSHHLSFSPDHLLYY